jgi:hypothetical protein
MKEKPKLTPTPPDTTTNMEVHHHTHTPRKKFKHYFFEFFMLFLAVFCGFLAEYRLEHTIEHQREEQFIESMISDLREDTVKINKVYEHNRKQVAKLDSLVRLMHRNPTHPDSIALAYYLFSNSALNYEMVVFTDRTMSQLKNSGGMRLIRKQSVSDSIMNYDAGVKNTELQFSVVKEGWQEATSFSYQIFDLNIALRRGDTLSGKNQYAFIENNPQLLKAYANRLIMFSGVVIGYTINLREQKANASRLIAFLKEQYDID